MTGGANITIYNTAIGTEWEIKLMSWEYFFLKRFQDFFKHLRILDGLNIDDKIVDSEPHIERVLCFNKSCLFHLWYTRCGTSYLAFIHATNRNKFKFFLQLN